MRNNYPARKVYAALALIILIIATGIFLSHRSTLTPHGKKYTGEDPSGLTATQSYIGSEGCRSCHGKEYEDWKESFHDQAMMEATALSVKGNFNTSFTSQDVTSAFYRKDDKFFVTTEGPDGAYHDYEVAYTFGVSPLQQYLIKFPNGKLQCLRTAWDTEKNKWFDLYPDYSIKPDEWVHWSGGGQNWNTMCADCHSTNVKKDYNEDKQQFNTTFSIMNVGCEACHGPGRKHVDLVSAKTYDSSASNNGSLIASLASQTQINQCAQCHSRRAQHKEDFVPESEFMDHYVAEILRDDLYYPDGQIREEVYEYGSFLQSKMYRNNVKCSDCHNPHSLKLKEIGNNLCGQCHSSKTYDTFEHHFHKMNSEGASCVNCHMPGRVYMGNDFRRDHSLRVPRPDLSVTYDTPNACNQCHSNRSPEWASKAIVKWYGPERKPHFSEALTLGSTRSVEAVGPLISLLEDMHQPAIARATAVWYLDQIVTQESIDAIVKSLSSKDPIVRYTAVNALSDNAEEETVLAVTPLLRDPISTIGQAAANAMAGVAAEHIRPDFQAGLEKNLHAYEKSLAIRADFPGGQLEKGIFYYRTGRIDLAEKAYLRAIALDNRFNAARMNLAHLYNGQGKNEKAIALFKTIIDQEPGFGGGYYSLGLLYAEENNLREAVSWLSKAAVLEKNPRIYYNLGIAYQQMNHSSRAEETYLKGLQLHAADPDLLYALSVLYIQQNQLEKARPYVDKLSTILPENIQVRQMVQIVRQ